MCLLKTAVDTDQMKTEMFVLNAPVIDSYQIFERKKRKKKKKEQVFSLVH